MAKNTKMTNKAKTARKVVATANTSISWKTKKPVQYGSAQGTGTAKPGKAKFPVSITFNNTIGGRGSYIVETKKGHRSPLTRFLRVLGAMGFSTQAADMFLADHGLPGISMNTLRSQLHSGYRGTLPEKVRKQTSVNKKSDGLHHGSAEPDDMKGYSFCKEACKYYTKRAEELASAGR